MVLLYDAFDTLPQLVLGASGRQSQCSGQCVQVPRERSVIGADNEVGNGSGVHRLHQ